MSNLEQVVHVSGAGVEAANGDYYLKSKGIVGVRKYVMKGVWKGQNAEFTIKCHERGWDEKVWSILVPQAYSSNNDLLYSAPFVSKDPDLPPENGWSVSNHGKGPIPQVIVFQRHEVASVPVAEPVAAIYKEMLLSEDFSDIRFVCKGGETIPAHKIVLAASSPYFKAAFNGQWKDSGEIHVDHPAPIVEE